MSVLRQLRHKSPNPQSLLPVAARCLSSETPNFDSFPEEPTSAYYDDQVNAAGQSRDFEKLHYLLNKRAKDAFFNTTNTFRFITAATADLLAELDRTLARLDEGFTRKSAYDSLIARLSKLEKVDEALRVAETMARGKYGLSACSFHPILSVVTRKKRMEDAWRVVEAMRSLGAPPDMTAYNYLLSAYCFTGELDAAAEVLRTAEEEGMKADGRTYDALVLGACKAGKAEAAMVLLRRMADDGVPQLLSTHVYVVDSLLRMGFSEQAVKFVRSFSGRDTWLETQTYGILASRLMKLKRLDQAKSVLNEMIAKGLVMGDRLKHQLLSKNRLALPD